MTVDPGILAGRFAPLAIAPEDEAERERWLEELVAWRADAREALEFTDDRYLLPQSKWASDAYVCGLVMLWDERFYDHRSDRFLVEEYLDETEREFGGLDALILWHAYPRIGFDERNQFDFYREIPGGLEALADIVARLHARGVRALLDYNPWDTATRREDVSDDIALADLFRASGADGLFLDTLPNAGETLLDALDVVHPGTVLQSELEVPLDRVTDHLIGWVQWPEHLEKRLVLRNAWFEQRQMQHIVRRWHEQHTDELHTAWLNGTGVVVWDNVFGSWYPWNEQDRLLLAQMRPVQRVASRFFTDGTWTPYVATSAGVSASRWELGSAALWTISNRTDSALKESVCLGHRTGGQYIDVMTGAALGVPEIVVLSGGIACVMWVADGASTPIDLVGIAPATAVAPIAPAPLVRRAVPDVPVGELQHGQVVIAAGPRRLSAFFQLRECGTYSRFRPANDVAPELEIDIEERRDALIPDLTVDTAPVTNAAFALFLAESGYWPDDDRAFLRHWVDGHPVPGSGDEPVTFVSMDDARAYAAWTGGRLPTEDEWQVALAEGDAGYGTRRVWEWTESEHSDGRTRFAIIKGGSDLIAEGSSWYAERGPVDPDRSAKFLLFYPGLDRSSQIGFRCAHILSTNR